MPRITSGTTGAPERSRGGEGAGVKAQQPGLLLEGAFREEGQRAAAGGAAHHAQRVAQTPGAVVARNELHADALQQETRPAAPNSSRA